MSKIKTLIAKIVERYCKLNVAVKVSLWLTLCSIIQKGISVITMPVFTRLMSTTEFGRYSIFLSWYNILLLVITLNIQAEVFNKGLIDHSEEKDQFASNQVGLLITLTVVSLILYGLFNRVINAVTGLTTPLFLLVVLEILGNAIFSLWCARQRFEFKYKAMVALTLFSAVATPVLGIIAVGMTEKQAEAKIFSNAIVPMLMACVLLIVFKRRGRLFSNFLWWKTSILAALPLLPHYLSLILLNQSDKLMINAFIGPEDTAIYSVAHTAGLLMTIINGSVNASFVPWSYNKLKNGQGHEIKRISTSLMLLIMGVNLLVIWLAPEAVYLLAAPQYADAVYCLVPIAVSVYFYFAYTLFVDVEIYYSGNKYVAIASVTAAVVNLALNYIFIPVFGYIAAGYTTLFSYFLTMIMHYAFLSIIMKKQKDIKISELFNIKAILGIGILFVAVSCITMLIYPYWIIRWGVLMFSVFVVFQKREVIMNLVSCIKRK